MECVVIPSNKTFFKETSIHQFQVKLTSQIRRNFSPQKIQKHVFDLTGKFIFYTACI